MSVRAARSKGDAGGSSRLFLAPWLERQATLASFTYVFGQIGFRTLHEHSKGKPEKHRIALHGELETVLIALHSTLSKTDTIGAGTNWSP